VITIFKVKGGRGRSKEGCTLSNVVGELFGMRVRLVGRIGGEGVLGNSGDVVSFGATRLVIGIGGSVRRIGKRLIGGQQKIVNDSEREH